MHIHTYMFLHKTTFENKQYTSVHVCIHTHIQAYETQIHIQSASVVREEYIHTYIHTCMHACMHAYIHTSEPVVRKEYMNTYMHT